jgi:predicted dehydrogenase
MVAGISNCVGDIGSHIENTISYITGLKIKRLCAKFDYIPPTRPLETNAHILLEYGNGASGSYWCSQIAAGHENGLRVRIYGSKGSLEWIQETPNSLKICMFEKPVQIYTRGQGYVSEKSRTLTRLPCGHPEAYYEAFANLYSKFADALIKRSRGEELTEDDLWFTDVEDGLNGVRFINKCVESNAKGSIWVSF